MEGTVKYSSTTPTSASLGLPSSSTSAARSKQIWAIGGGKGGVGKSLIASSFAIALSRQGKKVIAIDLDLGGANLHTTLGVDLPAQTLSDFVSHRVDEIGKCVVPSGIPNLEIISGAHDTIGISNLNSFQKNELLEKIQGLDADYLIFDLGAGTGINTLDFFLFSNVRFIVMLPEPTSIENGYRFMKSAYYRHLEQCPSLQEIRPLIETAMDPKNPAGIRSPSDLFREANKINPNLGSELKKQIEHLRLKLVINQTRTQTDIDIGHSVKTVSKKYFGMDMDYIGNLDYDSAVWQSVRKKKPLMLEFPNSRIVSGVTQIVNQAMRQTQ